MKIYDEYEDSYENHYLNFKDLEYFNDDAIFKPENNVSEISCKGYPEITSTQIELYITDEKTKENTIQESNSKDLIKGIVKDNREIKFIGKKTLRDDNLNQNSNQIQEGIENIKESHLIPAEEEKNSPVKNKKVFQTYNIEQKKGPSIRIDDLNKELYYFPMIFMKKYFKETFNLDFDSFECHKVLGMSIRYMKSSLGKTIRELLCFYQENIEKIKSKLDSKMGIEEKKKLNYFLNITYEELFNRYVNGDINFPIFKGGTLRINGFITLKKALLMKEKEWGKIKKFKNNEKLLKEKIVKFENYSRNIINEIKSGKREREVKKKGGGETATFKRFKKFGKSIKKNIDSDGNGLEE